MKADIINYIFNYFKDNEEYIDKEELAVLGKITDEELVTQKNFETFVFDILKHCVSAKKYFYDEAEFFENYTLYLKYKEQRIIIEIIYGMGNFFTITKNINNYKSELEVDIETLTQ